MLYPKYHCQDKCQAAFTLYFLLGVYGFRCYVYPFSVGFCGQCKIRVQFHSSTIQVSQYHFLKRQSFSHCLFEMILDVFVEDQFFCICMGVFLAFLFIGLLCLFLCQYNTVLIITALQHVWKSESIVSPIVLLLLRIVIGSQSRFLVFPCKFQNLFLFL